jgi:ABC-2 type transport system permease protein
MRLANILHLGIKELRGLARDPVMLGTVVFAFTVVIYSAAKALPDNLHKASIAIVDGDRSQVSERIADAFLLPYFLRPDMVDPMQMDRGMDMGRYTFGVMIPPDFQRDLLARRTPEIQLNIDATRVMQAFTGNRDVQMIILGEVQEFWQRYRTSLTVPVDLQLRSRFNPELNKTWFGALTELINEITLLSIILTGAALLKEREHGTVEHLLVMPVTPFEIMVSKVWSMALVVLIVAPCSLLFIVQGVLQVPIQGSIALFIAGTALFVFSTTSLGILLATFARSMPQFGLLMVLVIMPLLILSGAFTPRESMPQFVRNIMLGAPNTHFVMLMQTILFRGAGIEAVWSQFAALALIGSVMFAVSLRRFRRTLGSMA